MNNSKSNFLHFFLNTAGTNILIASINFVSTILLSRILGPEGRGIYTLIVLLPTLVLTFGRLGIGHSINYYINRAKKEEIIFNSIIISFFLGFILLIVTFFIIPWIKPLFFDGVEETDLILISTVIPFLFFFDTIPSIFQGLYKIKIRNLIYLLLSLMTLICLSVFLVIFEYGVKGGIYAFLISHFIVVLFSLIILKNEVDFRKISFNSEFSIKLLIYGLKSHVGNVFKQLSYRGDILVVSYFMSPIYVGYYIVSVNLAEILWKLPEAIGVVLLPRISKEKSSTSYSVTPFIFKTLIYPMLLSVIFLLLFGSYVIKLFYGVEFLPSVNVLYIMLPGIFALSFWKILANDLIAKGHALKYSITSGLSAILMIILDIFLIPIFGINGAALATSISYATATVFISIMYLQVTKISIVTLLIPQSNDIATYRSILLKIIHKN